MLYIKAGTYSERMVNGVNGFRFANGTPGAYTRYAAAPGDEGKVIISPTSQGYNNFTVFFGNNSYIEMSGLVLDNSKMDEDRYLVKFGDDNSGQKAHNIVFKNNELRNARMGIGNGGGNEIIGNYFHDLRGYGIYTGGDNGLLDGNIFQNIGGYAIHHFQLHKTVNNWVIRNNVIANAGKTYISPHGDRPLRPLPAVVISRGTGNQFYNNVIYDSYAGLQVGLGAVNTLVKNNTIYGNDTFGINVSNSHSGSKNAQIIDNIVWGNGSQILNTGTNTTLQGNFTSDPQFVNAAGGNFNLKPGSPAADKGAGGDPTIPTMPPKLLPPLPTQAALAALAKQLAPSTSFPAGLKPPASFPSSGLAVAKPSRPSSGLSVRPPASITPGAASFTPGTRPSSSNSNLPFSRVSSGSSGSIPANCPNRSFY